MAANTYVLVRTVLPPSVWWYRKEHLDGVEVLRHPPMALSTMGGWHVRKPEDEVLDTVVAEQFVQLDWSRTTLIDRTSPIGWLSWDGSFYGCASEQHDFMARMMIHIEPDLLEGAGWVRVIRPSDDRGGLWAIGRRKIGNAMTYIRLSDAQRAWLLDHGHTLMEND